MDTQRAFINAEHTDFEPWGPPLVDADWHAFCQAIHKGIEGLWPCLYPWDVVRLRTSSSYWNDPVKYGPRSELFFFLIKKEPVALAKAVPFLRTRSRRVRRLVCTFWQQKVKLDQAVVSLLTWETCGDTVAQQAQVGTATANRGPKVKAFLLPTFASTMWKALLCMLSSLICQAKRCPSGGLELPRCCMLCQEMHEAWWVAATRRAHCHSKRSPSLTVDGL